jgi:large subunit ribosomal protein L24
MIKSKKPSKQRKYRVIAPTHVRRRMMRSSLSKELKKKHKKRSITVRKGDEVIVMKGSFKGTKGKVDEVKRKTYKIFIDNVQIEKKDGTKVRIGLDASKIMITSLNTSDPKRFGGDKK